MKDGDYEWIRRFKLTASSLLDSYVDLSEKITYFTETEDI